jgi:lysophospholipase L1-like esterase
MNMPVRSLIALFLAAIGSLDAHASQPCLTIVFAGDSITAGGGASVIGAGIYANPVGITSVVYPSNATDWVSLLRASLATDMDTDVTTFRIAMGGQKIADALSQYTQAAGIAATAMLTSGSNTATVTSVSGFLISGEVVFGRGVPANTVATFATAEQVGTYNSTTGSTTTLTMGSIAGLSPGMFVFYTGLAGSGTSGSASIPGGTTVSSISGNTVTLSGPISVFGSGTQSTKFYFVSPSITLSNAATASGTQPMSFSGSDITSTATFTANSTTAIVTGATTGLINYMGIGSICTKPGTTFTISGSTLTLSQPATASGTSASFEACYPTFDNYSLAPQQCYMEGLTTTPHLLSPAVTGVPGIFIINYCVNDIGYGGAIADIESEYLAYSAAARADGYTVVWTTTVPFDSNAFYGFDNYTAQQDTFNAWLKNSSNAYPVNSSGYDYVVDIASVFPPGHPTIANDPLHISDGVHPSDPGHSAMAGLLETFLTQQLLEQLDEIPPLITSAALIANTPIGAAYSFSLTATGYPAPSFTAGTAQLPPGLTLSPAGLISGTPTAPGTYTGTITASNSAARDNAQNFTITVTNTFTAWASQHGLTDDDAQPSAALEPDGLTNLLKYALGLDPAITYNPGATGVPLVQTVCESGVQYLSLSFDGSATDVTYTIEAADRATGPWSQVASYSGYPAPGAVTVKDSQPIAASPSRFMRLEISQP